MNKLEIKGDWNITKGKLKQKWAKLTDDDLHTSRASKTNYSAGFRSAPAKPAKRSKKRSRNPAPIAAASEPTFRHCGGANTERTEYERPRL